MLSRRSIHSLTSAALILLSWGCAADVPDEPSSSGDVIGFDATTDKAVDESPEGVTTTYNIKSFKVTATTRGPCSNIVLLDNAVVTRTGLNNWTYSPQIEWPATPVNFYMVSPVDVDWSVHTWDTGAMIWSYHNDGKTDLITAANYEMRHQSGPVRVNFRHALSRVEAGLRTTIPDDYELHVRLAYIIGVGLKGHYVWPTSSTQTQNAGDTGSPDVSGTWEVSGVISHAREVYVLEGTTGAEVSDFILESSDTYRPLDANRIQFMIPFELEESRFDQSNWLGSNIVVVYNIRRRSDGAIIWPNENTPFEYYYHTDGSREWAVAPYALAEATPEGRWLPGINYSYRLTLNMPQVNSRGAEWDVECDTTEY